MLGEAFPLCFRQKPIKLTNGERIIVWSLLKAYPDCVRKPTLLDRLDSEGVNNTIQVIICRIRRKLKDVGAPESIETVWGQGYRWKPGGGDDIAAKIVESDRPIGEILGQLYDVPGTADRQGG